ncbi:hypothetical protein L873DRAFT_1764614 [Choiromyces venosus 120613-1]|uniref:Pectate lyase n=1 Tax=Choiromyces venosus 120613-1 TaxID=1336337 RepID=A0A3N4JS57_9PEZI|nr:hypothetical protein L873DRAFT_1764614 [Choiromyces venosus 120613-1]
MGILAILWARFAVGYCISGGARGASDEIVQHNGVGTVEITDFFADTFGKIWTSCGNCSGNKGPREVILKGVIAKGGTVFAGANSNYGDTATIANSCGVTPSKMCQIYEGCDKSKGDCESAKLSTGFDEKTCIDGDGNTAIC